MTFHQFPKVPQSGLVSERSDPDSGDSTVDVPVTGDGIGEIRDEPSDLDLRAIRAGEAVALSLIRMTEALRAIRNR